jgi:hypothetical protein
MDTVMNENPKLQYSLPFEFVFSSWSLRGTESLFMSLRWKGKKRRRIGNRKANTKNAVVVSNKLAVN